jgi:hypothetical protein
VLGAFGPNANAFKGVPYATIELYLMGLATGSEVPASITMLSSAKIATATTTATVVEASGVSTLQFSSIVARHGTPKLLPSNARHFSGAFVVVSKAPASDSVMNDVASFAAAFGKRKVVSNWPSFVDATGGRATMSVDRGIEHTETQRTPHTSRLTTTVGASHSLGAIGSRAASRSGSALDDDAIGG